MTSRRRIRRNASKSVGPLKDSNDAAATLLASGLGLSLLSLVVGKLIFGAVLKWLLLIGVFLVGVGAVLLWMRADERRAPGRFAEPGKQVPPDFGWDEVPVVDRTVTELFRELDGVSTGVTKREHPRQWGADVFDVIEWRRFEAVIQHLFQQDGYDAKSQSHGADKGVDVWLYSKSEPETPYGVVQCKHWSGKQVGVDKVRELRGVMAAHSVRRGQFATSSTFTRDAIEFAGSNNITLLDKDGLLALIGQRSASQRAELLSVALEGEYWCPTCVNCGAKMVERQPKKQGSSFWGCKHYPRCKTTLPMRAL